LAAPIGPAKGIPEIASAAEAPINAGISGSKSLREQRPDRAIDQPANENFFLARTTFALEESARNLACRVGLFLVVNGQREKVPARIRSLAAHGCDQYLGLGHIDQNCAVGLACDSTGFQRYLVLSKLESLYN
jgi:hypothetical protein